MFIKKLGLFFVAASILVGFHAGAAAQDDAARATFTNAPNWIQEISIPKKDDAQLSQIADGVYYLISDRQVRIEEDSFTHYRRFALEVVSRAGLEEAGRIQVDFDPTHDELQIHHIRIIRNGEVLDRASPEDMLVTRREEDLSNGVTDGDLTAYIEIRDVRVGDIVDYSFSWQTQAPLWPGEFSLNFSAGWSVPLADYRTRILTPHDKPLKVIASSSKIEPASTNIGTHQEYLWRFLNQLPKAAQDTTPQTYYNWGNISVSTFAGWSAVADFLAPRYEAQLQLPSDFIEQNQWFNDVDREKRITSAIRYVQDQIRYVADETGVGSHIPRPPAEVIARGWGDCKDKSQLLVAILRAMGEKAFTALVDNDEGFALQNHAPSPFAFDHAVVMIRNGQNLVWIDATYFSQGGVFPNIPQPSYGFALPLKPGVEGLVEMNAGFQKTPTKVVRETFDRRDFATDGVHLSVHSEYRSHEADSFRRSLSDSSRGKLLDTYRKYYDGYFPGIEVFGELDIQDDRDANVVSTRENYFVPRSVYNDKDIENAWPLRADSVLGVFTDVSVTDRSAPIGIPHPVFFEHIIKVIGTTPFPTGPDDFEIESESFWYQRNTVSDADSLTLSFRLQSRDISLPLDKLDQYTALTDDLNAFGYQEYGEHDEGYTAEDFLLFGAFAVLAIYLIYLPFGIRATFTTDRETIDSAVFFPINLQKFVILSTATLGFYSIFWMYRCWRWIRYTDKRQIMPLWRAIFSIIWFYPLFTEIRERQIDVEKKAMSVILGAALTAGYVIVTIASAVGEGTTSGINSLAASIMSGLVFLLTLPLLSAVNTLNENDTGIIQKHSSWSVHSILALFSGAALWIVMFIGSFAPQ